MESRKQEKNAIIKNKQVVLTAKLLLIISVARTKISYQLALRTLVDIEKKVLRNNVIMEMI